ncbi:MAG: hypothetical protein JWM44_2118 [Bacilli bacterium]|nr:hypothetical protein [Bacilli bacterium]
MLKNLALVLLFISFLTFICFVGELFWIRLEAQSALDRSTTIAVHQTMNQLTPDLQIDSTKAQTIFNSMAQQNLLLDSSFLATTSTQRIRSVLIQDFHVFNVFSPTTISVTNPISGAVQTTIISSPSVQMLAIVTVHIAFWPTDIQLPIYAASSSYNPL